MSFRKRLKKNIICSSATDPETSSNELLLSSVDNVNIIGTVLKTEPDRYNTDNTQTNTTPQKCNGIPVHSIHPGPSHEIPEPDPSHHISLVSTNKSRVSQWQIMCFAFKTTIFIVLSFIC